MTLYPPPRHGLKAGPARQPTGPVNRGRIRALSFLARHTATPARKERAPGAPVVRAIQGAGMRLCAGLLALFLVLGGAMSADTVPATGGAIELTPMAHAHVQIEFGGKVIHVDP